MVATATYLIGKHLEPNCTMPPIRTCALCGAENIPGYPLPDIIGPSFMDWGLIDHAASGICVYCAACLGTGRPRTEWLRSASFLATQDYLLRLKREDIWEFLLAPPDLPFVFGVTYTHKKHISFKAPINYSKERYFVQTEDIAIEVTPSRIQRLCQVMQDWYTARKDIKTAPTWFTKRDILQGCQNFKRIEAYGVARYIEGDQVISPFRGTALLRLLTYALNKSQLKKGGEDD